MPRKRWIKFWTQETLYGTTSIELKLDEQACWFKLLALAGDSPEPGRVEVAPGVPMTDQQIAAIFRAPLNVWLRTKSRLLAPDVNKILLNEGILHIVNWEKYQSDWNRIKDYPSQQPTAKPTNSSNVGDHTTTPTGITDQNRPEQNDIYNKDINLIYNTDGNLNENKTIIYELSLYTIRQILQGKREALEANKKRYRAELERLGIPITQGDSHKGEK